MNKLGFIGGGNMAQAIITGILANQQQSQIWVVEPYSETRDKLARISPLITIYPDSSAVTDWEVDTLIIAVKPQQCKEALLPIGKYLNKQIILSIAAGLSIACLSKWLGAYKKIVRSMPNTPALVKQGITALFYDCLINQNELVKLQQVIGAIGEYIFVETEEKLDVVTAISGSGPAYVCYFIESLIAAATNYGLDQVVAKQLVLATINGSCQLIKQSETDISTLRQQVTSKGGTTEAALAVLADKQFSLIIDHAVQAAVNRSQQLGQILSNS